MPIILNSNAEALRQQMLGGSPGEPPLLQNHPTQSTVAIDGWSSTLFGIPFLLGGVAIIAAALNFLPGHKNAPNWLIGLVGSFFLLGGSFFIGHGIHGLLRKAAHRREAAAQVSQPWLADYRWQHEGASFSAFNSMVGRLFSTLFWNAFLIPFLWVGLSQPGLRIFLVGAALFALIGLFFWARWFQMLGQLLRYGNSFLAYDSFPYFTGSSFQARLRAPHHFDRLDELTITLRCVQERYIMRGYGNDRSRDVACYELYKDVASFTREQIANASASYLPITFRVPENQPSTRLADTPPTYWEIEARGTAKGVDYQAFFLVPIYSAR